MNVPERWQLVQGRNSWQKVKHSWLYSDLLQALKGEPLSSGFSTDGSLISAPAIPHCRAEMEGGRETCSSWRQPTAMSFYFFLTVFLYSNCLLIRLWLEKGQSPRLAPLLCVLCSAAKICCFYDWLNFLLHLGWVPKHSGK